MQNNLPKVSIIIINWNCVEQTIRCLHYLEKVNYPNYEIIVVDNGSKKEEARTTSAKFTNKITIISNPENLGFAEANNIALKKTLADENGYSLLLNSDTIVPEEFLSQLIETMESNPKIAISAPTILNYIPPSEKTDLIQSAGAVINLYTGNSKLLCAGQDYSKIKKQIKKVDYVSGSCLMIRNRILKEIGLLDKNYFSYFEETDLCLRINRKGYLVVSNDMSKIWHRLFNKNGSELKNYYMARNRILFEKKFANSLQLFVFYIYLLAFIIPKTIVKFIMSRDQKTLFKASLKGIVSGIKGK